ASAPTFVNVVVTPGGIPAVPPASEDTKKKKKQEKVQNEDLTRSPDNSI
ncbi:MAG: protease, partial [Arthrobacter sp.]|nr:protease [Arthrobacter sp.]